MINTTGLLMNAWYSLLHGNVTGFTVYKDDVSEAEEGNYVVLRAEGGSEDNNKRSFADDTVVVVDIVSKHQQNIDRSVVEAADSIIGNLILPTAQTNGLTAQGGMQILNVRRENFAYLIEEDESNKYYRKVSRYAHKVYQTA
jgi:hypothetical protein